MPEDIVRVLRILEYVGPRSAIERTLAGNAVKGTQHFGQVRIDSAILGESPQVVAGVKNDAS